MGTNDTIASYGSLIINGIILVVLTYIIYIVFRLILVTILAIIAKKTKTKFDDLLIHNKSAKYVSHLVPLLFIHKAVPIILKDYVYWETLFAKLTGIYIVLLVLWIVRTLLNALRDYLKQKPKLSDKPFTSYINVLMIILWSFGIIFIILFLFDTSFKTLLTTFGAISAIIILIFRDSILGLAASIQVSINDMVRIGDWVTMEKYGADGEIIEINLATVTVRNFDRTTTTIPAYSLISDSFKNWRSMFQSDGRRIKRHLLIKAGTIRFLKDNELEGFKDIDLIKKYIETKQAEIHKFNTDQNVNKSLSINGRNLTNLGLFRKYIINYLEQHPGINKNTLLMCRQLQATPQGIPLEIYAFSKDKRFENYEYIMADIFDHIYAATIYFDLEIYEMPAGKSVFDK